MRGHYGNARARAISGDNSDSMSGTVVGADDFWTRQVVIEQRPPRPEQRALHVVWAVASAASVAVSTYHGYKRNDSIGWALVWGACGGLFPVVTPAIAIAQGLGKPAR